MIALTDQQKKLVKWVGYPFVAVVAFLMALHYTFPYRRLEDKVRSLLGKYYEVSRIDIGPGLFPGDLVVRDLKLKTRPEREGEKAITLAVDELVLDIGVLAALGKELDVEFDATVGDGEVEGAIVRKKNGDARVELDSDGFPLMAIPGVKAVTGGAAVEGRMAAHLDFELPEGKWKQAEGVLELSCSSCALPKETKLRPMPGTRQSNAFSSAGFTLPAKVRFGEFGGKVVIDKGIGKFEDFSGKSPDGEIVLEGEIRFEDPVGRSQVTAYLMFKFSDELRRREPKMADIELVGLAGAKRPDGFYGVRITGPLNRLIFRPSKTSPVKIEGGVGEPATPPVRRPPPTPPSTRTVVPTPVPEPEVPAEPVPDPEPPPQAEAEAAAPPEGEAPGGDSPDRPGMVRLPSAAAEGEVPPPEDTPPPVESSDELRPEVQPPPEDEPSGEHGYE